MACGRRARRLGWQAARMHEALRRIKRASSQTVAEADSPTCLTDAENAVPMQRYRFIRRLGQGDSESSSSLRKKKLARRVLTRPRS